MYFTLAIVGSQEFLANLRGTLRLTKGIEWSEIDDWDVRGTSLDAPFNAWQPGVRLGTVTTEFAEGAWPYLAKALVSNVDQQEVVFLNPLKGTEIFRIHNLGNGETVVQFGDIDILRTDAGFFVSAARGLDGAVVRRNFLIIGDAHRRVHQHGGCDRHRG